jgi:PAS domain S-box-containing protein
MAQSETATVTKTPLRVLLIEDSEFDALLLTNVLRAGGYEVSTKRVQTGPDMRAALAANDWDIVFSDHEMPQFSAPEALEILQETGRDLPFIIVSGGIGEDVAVAAMKAGAHDYLIKGNLGRLVPAVQRELREAQNRAARRSAELSLRESELRYRLLWENSPDAVILVDAEGLMRFVNPAVTELFGHPPASLLGRSFLMLQPDQMPDAQDTGLCCAWDPSQPKQPRHMIETVGLRNDGRQFPIEIGFSNMELEGKGWFVAFIRDVSERKAAESALREKEEQLRVARDIQQRLFPKSSPAVPGYDIAGASYPAEATGGDYFDYLPMLQDGLGIVVGDVTGHGIGPALLMAETRAYLRIVALNRALVGEVLTRANRVLAEDVGNERFVTVLLARLEAAQRILAFANAGHPAGYLLDGNGQVKLRLTRTGPPLGVRPDTQYSDSPRIQLESGDLVLLLTDGFEETMAPDSSFYGAERALEVVRAHRDQPAQEIVTALYASVRAFAQGEPQLDDLTLVVLKVL